MSSDSAYSAKNPYSATLHSSTPLNGNGSAKDTRHVVIELGDAMTYEPGDSLGVLARNNDAFIAAIIARLEAGAETMVMAPKAGGEMTLHELLATHEISKLPKALLQPAAAYSHDDTLKRAADPAEADFAKAFTDGRDVLDLLQLIPVGALPVQELANGLRPLLPRLYSIASSLKAHPSEVHLTIGVVRWESHGRIREGVASTYLGLHCAPGDTVRSFVHHCKTFKLPTEPSTDIIMIGPGTGIAPFRAFLQERRLTGASGRNWLFFGDQHAATDYLYGDEFRSMQHDGLLNRVDLAFSRDQTAKVYVQHRMLEQAAELWRWLENGAHLYVCGDALRMAKDVDAALHQIIRDHGGVDEDGAAAMVKQMKKDKRYQRDVYAV